MFLQFLQIQQTTSEPLDKSITSLIEQEHENTREKDNTGEDIASLLSCVLV